MQTLARAKSRGTADMDLEAMAEVLVDVVKSRGGSAEKRDALVESARRLGVTLSQMSYVLIYARSSGIVTTNSIDSTIRVD